MCQVRRALRPDSADRNEITSHFRETTCVYGQAVFYALNAKYDTDQLQLSHIFRQFGRFLDKSSARRSGHARDDVDGNRPVSRESDEGTGKVIARGVSGSPPGQ